MKFLNSTKFFEIIFRSVVSSSADRGYVFEKGEIPKFDIKKQWNVEENIECYGQHRMWTITMGCCRRHTNVGVFK
jgi:hypothetical protein